MAARAAHARDEVSSGQFDVISEALAEAEQARRDRLAASERLRRSNAELRHLQRELENRLAAIDEWSAGRLRELIEHTADELATIVHVVLDGSQGIE
jgi:DNA anti-recombination protein RmuC